MAKEWKGLRDGDDEARSDERWLVTYADMITVLLIFFITMYAVSTRLSAATFEKLAKSLKNSLNEKTKEKVVDPRSHDTERKDGVVDTPIAHAVAPFKGKSLIKVDRISEGTRISLADTSFFALGSTTLKDDGKQALLAIAKVVATSDLEISVEGHTDSVRAASDTGTSNWVMAATRAANVMAFLNIQGKIPAKRFQVVSYAEYRPLFPNDSPEHRAANRRVDIVIHDTPPQKALHPTPTPSDDGLGTAGLPDANGLPTKPNFHQPAGGNGGAVTNPFGNSF